MKKNNQIDLPLFLEGKISIDKYENWVKGKAISHYGRDRKKFEKQAKLFNLGRDDYRKAILDSIEKGNGKDYYTGEELNWGLVAKWDNEEAQRGGSEYRKKFHQMPSVDHYSIGSDQVNFRLCSLIVNDMKSDLAEEDFIKICKKVIEHKNR